MTDTLLSEFVKYLLPVLSVALGWALNEASQSLKLRRDSRHAIGRVLTNLIDIRHTILGIDYMVEKLSKLGMPSGQVPAIKAVLHQLFPELFGDESFHRRYQEAVDIISGEDPVLAYRLQQRDMVTPFFNRVRAFAAQDVPLSSAWGSFEPELMSKFLPILEELILELAWAHGYKTWFKVKRTIKVSLAASAELDALLNSFLASIAGKKEPGK